MADIIDYKLHRSTNDLVEIALDPQEAIVIETGSMIMMDDVIEMKAIIGDGSEKEKGFFGKLIGSGKRMITGEGLFMTMLENTGSKRGNVLLSPGGSGSQILPVDLSKLDTPFMVNKGHFLAAARGVEIGMGLKLRPVASMIGSAELIMHELNGNGFAFMKSNGPIFTRSLEPGEKIKVDQFALVGMQKSVNYKISLVKGVKSMLFSGEGFVLYEVEGPGVVVLQGYNELELLAKKNAEKNNDRT